MEKGDSFLIAFVSYLWITGWNFLSALCNLFIFTSVTRKCKGSISFIRSVSLNKFRNPSRYPKEALSFSFHLFCRLPVHKEQNCLRTSPLRSFGTLIWITLFPCRRFFHSSFRISIFSWRNFIERLGVIDTDLSVKHLLYVFICTNTSDRC